MANSSVSSPVSIGVFNTVFTLYSRGCMKTALSDSIEFIGAIQINLSIYLSIYTDGQLNMVRYGIRQKAQRVYTVCRQLPCFTLTDDERFYHVFKRLDFSTCSTFLTFFCILSPACIFTARCYASAVLAMGLCLSSVCPSQVGVLSKRLNESSWFLPCELPSTRPTLC